MTFILDTNVLSDLHRPDKSNAEGVSWASSVPVAIIVLSVVALLETDIGALPVERKDGARPRW